MGGFVTSRLPDALLDDIEFLPFPSIGDSKAYEEAPTDLFMIARRAPHPENAKKFIEFMAQANIQSQLGEQLGFLPPHRYASVNGDKFVQSGFELLRASDGVSQYFDRDTLPAFEKPAVRMMADFVQHGNVERLANELELLRHEVWSK